MSNKFNDLTLIEPLISVSDDMNDKIKEYQQVTNYPTINISNYSSNRPSNDLSAYSSEKMSDPTINQLSNKESIKITNQQAKYIENNPKILLETITASTASIIILITYASFIGGFILDAFTTLKSFHSANKVLSSYGCPSNNITSDLSNDLNYGCLYLNDYYGVIKQLENVVSIQLNAQRSNLTFTSDESYLLVYSVELYACYLSNGCSNQFSGSYDTSWMSVLSNYNSTSIVAVNSDISEVTIGIFPNTFQNQESIPTNGLVKSYYISIQYISDPLSLFTDPDALDSISYTFDVVSRPNQLVSNSLTVILIFFTIIILFLYCYIIFQSVKDRNIQSNRPIYSTYFWLTEQRWIVVYFIAVLLYQNPLAIVIDFSNLNSSIGSYVSYLFDQISQALLFVLWLSFADSINRKFKQNLWHFYLPKAFFGLCILVCGVFIITCQFPTLDPAERNNRNPVSAVNNWSNSLKIAFCAFSITYLGLQWLWTFTWFTNIYLSSNLLNKLPYMNTRYLQLSHRFFTVQATAVTLYFVFQYVIVIYLISSRDTSTSINLTNLTDNINTLFREQTQLFGKILFLSIYAFLLAFLFLPANFMSNSNNLLLLTLKSTYVISENELNIEKINRRKQFYELKMKNKFFKNLFFQLKLDIFCVDIALTLRTLSFQAYYDDVSKKTASAYEAGHMDLKSNGFELIEIGYYPEHETFCYIAREKHTRRLVVAFRGTASRKQMEHNLNYAKRPLDIFSLRLTTLDTMDGLDLGNTNEIKDEASYNEVINEQLSFFDEMEVNESTSNNIQLDRGSNENLPSNTLRETIIDGARGVERGVIRMSSVMADATNQVVDTATGLLVDAAKGAVSITPGLNIILKSYVHSGFWESYEVARGFIHAILRRELVKEPADVMFTGHSLGGALATYAALDVSIHTIPRVNNYLFKQKMIASNSFEEQSPSSKEHRYLAGFSLSAFLPFKHTNQSNEPNNNNDITTEPSQSISRSTSYQLPTQPTRQLSNRSINQLSDQPSNQLTSQLPHQPTNQPINQSNIKFKPINVCMYNFGSPKCGNNSFKQLYDRIVPNSFRVIVDGDLVTRLPPSGYSHIGTAAVVDSLGSGSIIIDPSFVERWLRTQKKASVSAHSLLIYRKGLEGVRYASEYISLYKSMNPDKNLDMKSYVESVNSKSFIKTANEANNKLEIIDESIDELIDEPKDKQNDNILDKQINNQLDEPIDIQIDKLRDEPISQTQYEEALHQARDMQTTEELMNQMSLLKHNRALNFFSKSNSSIDDNHGHGNSAFRRVGNLVLSTVKLKSKNNKNNIEIDNHGKDNEINKSNDIVDHDAIFINPVQSNDEFC